MRNDRPAAGAARHDRPRLRLHLARRAGWASASRSPSAASSSMPPRRGSPSRSPPRAASSAALAVAPTMLRAAPRRRREDDGRVTAPTYLGALLLSADEATAMEARGGTEAAVLLPLYGWPAEPGLIFTERRADLRRHAGEMSFPGGRRIAGDADLEETALREAQEEIALDPAGVEIVGALPPVSTFVTGYRIQPFVGLVDDPLYARARAQPDRGRDRLCGLPRPPPRGLRDEAPDPPRRPHPHADLRGRRAADLGRDRPDPGRLPGFSLS